MTLPLELLATARRLIATVPPTAELPTQADLRRCISTIYYALFHATADRAAAALSGSEPNFSQSGHLHIYRALDHSTVMRACRNQETIKLLSPEMANFAAMFARMQTERHKADYDPQTVFEAETVRRDLEEADVVIRSFLYAKENDRRLFLAFALFKFRAS